MCFDCFLEVIHNHIPFEESVILDCFIVEHLLLIKNIAETQDKVIAIWGDDIKVQVMVIWTVVYQKDRDTVIAFERILYWI